MSENRRALICFTGIDGSGKTTHAKSFVKYLKENGYSCTYVWAASKPFFSYILFGFTRLLKYWKTARDDAFLDPLELAPQPIHDRFGPIVRLFFFMDFQIRTLFKVKIPLWLGRIVICDRYVYDLIMELMLHDLYSSRFGNLLLRTIPLPQLTIFTDVSENILVKRRSTLPSKNLPEKKKIYLKLAKTFEFIILDTSVDFEENQRKIREKAMPVLKPL